MLMFLISLGFYLWLLMLAGYSVPWAWGYHNPLALNNLLAYGLGRASDAAQLPLYSFFKGMYVDIWMFINSIWLDIKYFTFSEQTLKSIAESGLGTPQTTTGTAEIRQVINEFINMPIIAAIVKISTTISIVFVFIRFAQIVMNAYFLNSASSNLTFEGLSKKLIVSLLATFLAPYLMLNGICLAAAFGISVGNSIYSAAADVTGKKEIDSENIVASYYYYSKKYGISASSFCDDSSLVGRADDEKVTSLYGPYNASSMDGNLTFPQRIQPKNDEMEAEEKIWNKFCANRLQSDDFVGLNNKIMHKLTKPDIVSLDIITGGEFEDVQWKGTYPARVGQVLMDYDIPKSDLFLVHYDFSSISFEVLILFFAASYAIIGFILKNRFIAQV